MLIGSKPSTKHYTIDPVSDIATKGKVEMAYEYESQTIPVENIDDLYGAIDYVRENDKAYIIRGLGQADYQAKVRRTLVIDNDHNQPNFMEVGSAWVCCDFDQYEVSSDINRTSIDAVEYLIDTYLPKQFKDVTYVYQWSASAGLEYKKQQVKSGTSVHLFFYLDSILNNLKLKAWFKKQEKEGFDISTFNTVTPIFVNTNVVKDPRIIDVIEEKNKFGLVRKLKNIVQVPNIQLKSNVPTSANQQLSIDTQDKILQALNSVGAIYKRGQGYYKLWHRGEGSKGDWFVYTKNLKVVHHHVKKSMSTQLWLEEYWGLVIQIEQIQINARTILGIKDLDNNYKI
jgi:hypothetical protein